MRIIRKRRDDEGFTAELPAKEALDRLVHRVIQLRDPQIGGVWHGWRCGGERGRELVCWDRERGGGVWGGLGRGWGVGKKAGVFANILSFVGETGRIFDRHLQRLDMSGIAY